jgi:type IV pilus assembly protein PilM
MSLFNKKNESYLGVDLGNSGIKLVELKNEKGKPKLLTYSYVDFPVDQKKDLDDEKYVVSVLKKMMEKSKVTTNQAVLSLPNFSAFSSVISLPKMKKKELDQAVFWEAKKFIPLPLEEMVLYSIPIEDTQKEEIKKTENNEKQVEDNGDFMKVLVVAATKKAVNKYMSICQQAGLEVVNLETEAFALERCLVGDDMDSIMIVDIGAISTDIMIIEDKIPVLNRSVDVGGNSITEHIQKSLNLDSKRSEQFKRDIGFGENSIHGISKIIEDSIETVINEIKYCFDLHIKNNSGRQVEKIVLTGGSAFLAKLDDYLANLLNINVVIGDPWDRVIYPVDLKLVLDQLGPRLAVAIGLAMREIE